MKNEKLEAILEGLNEKQREGATHIDGACCVLAGAGMGKTKLLTSRVQYMVESGINPTNILTFTFTKKASEEMKERLKNNLGDKADYVTIGTFHSIYFSILRDYYSRTGQANVELVTDYWKDRTFEDIIKKYAGSLDINAKQLGAFVSSQKNQKVSHLDDVILDEDHEFMREFYQLAYKEYEREKEKLNKIDFDDMIFKVYQIFSKDKDFLQKYRNKYQYILVDEFQDSNELQERMLEFLAEEHRNLFVVGDARQAIYGFQGSRVQIILDFQKKWDAKLVELNINYRCSKNIVEYSNKLISHSSKKLGGDAIAHNPKYKEPIFLESYNEHEEAVQVASEIEIMINNNEYKADEIAILMRTNAQSLPIETELVRRSIPYVVMGGLGFYDRKEVADIIAYLKLAVNPHDDKAITRIVNTPSRYLGKAFVKLMEDYAHKHNCSIYTAITQSGITSQFKYSKAKVLVSTIDALRDFSNQRDVKVDEIITYLLEAIEYDECVLKKDFTTDQRADKLENIETLKSFTTKFKTIETFLTHVEIMKKKANEDGFKGKVNILTSHKSKGLQWRAVFVIGVSNYQMPFMRERFETDIEEERRLCYVALTRAEKELYISSIASYNNKEVEPSQFIREMLPKRRFKNQDTRLGSETHKRIFG